MWRSAGRRETPDVAAARPSGYQTRAALLLVVASVLVYSANMREISAPDTIPTRLLALSVVEAHTLTLDRYFVDSPPGRVLPIWLHRAGGHYRSPYSILPALLAVPIYFVPVRLFGGESWALVNLLAKLSATLLAGLSVLFVYRAVGQLADASSALGISLVYAFATSTWSTSSQGLWQHGPAQLFMAAALYWLLRGEEQGRFVAYAGIATTLMVVSRPQTAVVGAALMAYALHRDWRRGLGGLGAAVAAAVPFLLYNLRSFGSIAGAFADVGARHAFYHPGSAPMWGTSLAEGLPGLLVSPSRGLMVYSPVLVFALAGMVVALLRRHGYLFHYLAVGFLGTLLMYGQYSQWWGGHSFGPRYLADVLPILAMFLIPVWRRVEESRVATIAFVGLFAVSVSIQAIGAFYYPSPRHLDWNTSPQDVDLAPDRVWDWSDPQVLRLLRNGPRPLGFGPLG